MNWTECTVCGFEWVLNVALTVHPQEYVAYSNSESEETGLMRVSALTTAFYEKKEKILFKGFPNPGQ